MIKLEEALTTVKLKEITEEIERLKKLSSNFNRVMQIKALQRLIEANNQFCKNNMSQPVDS
jgi:hypothetical protein